MIHVLQLRVEGVRSQEEEEEEEAGHEVEEREYRGRRERESQWTVVLESGGERLWLEETIQEGRVTILTHTSDHDPIYNQTSLLLPPFTELHLRAWHAGSSYTLSTSVDGSHALPLSGLVSFTLYSNEDERHTLLHVDASIEPVHEQHDDVVRSSGEAKDERQTRRTETEEEKERNESKREREKSVDQHTHSRTISDGVTSSCSIEGSIIDLLNTGPVLVDIDSLSRTNPKQHLSFPLPSSDMPLSTLPEGHSFPLPPPPPTTSSSSFLPSFPVEIPSLASVTSQRQGHVATPVAPSHSFHTPNTTRGVERRSQDISLGQISPFARSLPVLPSRDGIVTASSYGGKQTHTNNPTSPLSQYTATRSSLSNSPPSLLSEGRRGSRDRDIHGVSLPYLPTYGREEEGGEKRRGGRKSGSRKRLSRTKSKTRSRSTSKMKKATSSKTIRTKSKPKLLSKKTKVKEKGGTRSLGRSKTTAQLQTTMSSTGTRSNMRGGASSASGIRRKKSLKETKSSRQMSRGRPQTASHSTKSARTLSRGAFVRSGAIKKKTATLPNGFMSPYRTHEKRITKKEARKNTNYRSATHIRYPSSPSSHREIIQIREGRGEEEKRGKKPESAFRVKEEGYMTVDLDQVPWTEGMSLPGPNSPSSARMKTYARMSQLILSNSSYSKEQKEERLKWASFKFLGKSGGEVV